MSSLGKHTGVSDLMSVVCRGFAFRRDLQLVILCGCRVNYTPLCLQRSAMGFNSELSFIMMSLIIVLYVLELRSFLLHAHLLHSFCDNQYMTTHCPQTLSILCIIFTHVHAAFIPSLDQLLPWLSISYSPCIFHWLILDKDSVSVEGLYRVLGPIWKRCHSSFIWYLSILYRLVSSTIFISAVLLNEMKLGCFKTR
jgi:hypothetical protein